MKLLQYEVLNMCTPVKYFADYIWCDIFFNKYISFNEILNININDTQTRKLNVFVYLHRGTIDGYIQCNRSITIRMLYSLFEIEQKSPWEGKNVLFGNYSQYLFVKTYMISTDAKE